MLFDLFTDIIYYISNTELFDSILHYSYVIREYFTHIPLELETTRIYSSTYNVVTNQVEIKYYLNNKKYRFKFTRDENINMEELKMLLLQEDIGEQLISVDLNDKDITRELNEYYGPRGDFHEYILNRKQRLTEMLNTNLGVIVITDFNGEMFMTDDFSDEIMF